MSEIKIKNITVVVDGQEHSFSSRSVVPNKPYDATKDPEVQGTGLADLQSSNETPDNGGTPAVGTEDTPATLESAPSDTTATEAGAEPAAVEPMAETVEPLAEPTE